jgi:hypothetical protein
LTFFSKLRGKIIKLDFWLHTNSKKTHNVSKCSHENSTFEFTGVCPVGQFFRIPKFEKSTKLRQNKDFLLQNKKFKKNSVAQWAVRHDDAGAAEHHAPVCTHGRGPSVTPMY